MNKIMDMLVVANQAHADWVLDFAEDGGPSGNTTEALIAARLALQTEVTRMEAEVLQLHASLAESVLHAHAGWARYENSNSLVKGYQAELAALKAEVSG